MENCRRSGQGSQPSAARLGRLLPLSEQYVCDERDETLQPRPAAPVALAQARLHARPVELLLRRATARLLWTLRTTDDSGMEGSLMNEFGEPNMGNPSVRFDEGRGSVGHWPPGLSIHPLLPTLRNEEFLLGNQARRDWILCS